MDGIPWKLALPSKKVLVGTRRAMLRHAKCILIAFCSLFYVTENRL